jgi:hypothetical protein
MTKHLLCKLAVVRAITTAEKLEPDDAIRSRIEPLIADSLVVVRATEQLHAALVRATAASFDASKCWMIPAAEDVVKRKRDGLLYAKAIATEAIYRQMLPQDAPADTPWPWRREGLPWVWCSDLLLSLPQWRLTAIVEALGRLDGEGMIERHGWPKKHAVAVRLTARGAAFAEGGAA